MQKSNTRHKKSKKNNKKKNSNRNNYKVESLEPRLLMEASAESAKLKPLVDKLKEYETHRWK